MRAYPLLHARRALAHDARRRRVAKKWRNIEAKKPKSASVGRSPSTNGRRAKIASSAASVSRYERFDGRARRGVDTVTADEGPVLAAPPVHALHPLGRAALAHVLGQRRAHEARGLRKRPAIVHRRAPEPLVGVVLEQQAHERHRRVARRHAGSGCTRSKYSMMSVVSTSQATVGTFDLRDLRDAGVLGRATHVRLAERLEPVVDALGAEVGFELAGVVRRGAAVDDQK